MIRRLGLPLAFALACSFCQPGSPDPGPQSLCTVRFLAGSGGTLAGVLTQTVPAGGSTSPVTAVADSGFRFSGWSGDHEGNENPLVLAHVTADMTVTAGFAAEGTTAYPVSGRVTEDSLPLAGVTIAFSGGVASTATGAEGNYVREVPFRWSGTITPSLPGYQFTPESRFVSEVAAATAGLDFIAARTTPRPNLKIHYINVQQGQSIFIQGPGGVTVLLDGGDSGKGSGAVASFLRGLGCPSHIDFVVISHRDADHYRGVAELLAAGWSFGHLLDNGSDKAYNDARLAALPIEPMPVDYQIDLGEGARATCVAVNGQVLGHGPVAGALENENDRSVGLLVQYGSFDYIVTADLGGGSEESTERYTSQADLETPLVRAILPGGAWPLLSAGGVEVMHVAHHGSESSTNSAFMNGLSPRVACIAVGAGQASSWNHPRRDVVENVLLAGAEAVTASPALVLQTEEGAPVGPETSTAGYCVGAITIVSDGRSAFQVLADGGVSQGPDERVQAGLPCTLPLDGE